MSWLLTPHYSLLTTHSWFLTPHTSLQSISMYHCFPIHGEKVLKIIKTRGKICSVLSTRMSSHLDWKRTIHWNVFPNNSRHADILVIPGKFFELHFNVLLLSNPGEIVLTIVGITCSLDLKVWHIMILTKKYNCVKSYNLKSVRISFCHLCDIGISLDINSF